MPARRRYIVTLPTRLSGGRYHRGDCMYLVDKATKALTAAEVVRASLRPCGHCKPSPPTGLRLVR